MNTRKLQLIATATAAYPGLSVNDALFNYLRSIASQEQSLGDLIAKYLYAGRVAYNFDGVDDYAVLPYRAINVDLDIEIEWRSGTSYTGGTSRTIVSQTLSTVSTSQEFFMFVTSVGGISVRVGGVSLGLSGVTYAPNTKYRWRLQGTSSQLWVNDVLVATQTLNRGAVREPSAVTTLGATQNQFFYAGHLLDIRINGVLWQMSERNQNILLPTPTGLGTELITPTVLANPVSKGTQWTYLSDGRWQYVGDGTLNQLQFLLTADQPAAGFLEFDVESIVGVMTCSIGSVTGSSFSSAGRFRYFYTNKDLPSANASAVQFKRAGSSVASCIIKNISFKPLGTCNPMQLVNTTSDRWQEIIE